MLQKWTKTAERYAYRGWRGMLVRTFRLPNGQSADYDVIDNAPYVVVAAFTPAREAILIRQFRPGPEEILSSFCEGYVDKDETPERAAARELLEETGYRAGEIRYLREIRSAYTTERRLCLVATDCQPIAKPQGDEDEFIEVFTLPLAEFRAWMQGEDSGFTTVDAAYLALDALGWV